jgi:hypothetical protein
MTSLSWRARRVQSAACFHDGAMPIAQLGTTTTADIIENQPVAGSKSATGYFEVTRTTATSPTLRKRGTGEDGSINDPPFVINTPFLHEKTPACTGAY